MFREFEETLAIENKWGVEPILSISQKIQIQPLALQIEMNLTHECFISVAEK